ncbi:phosphotransferase enzyme family protein [Blastomyces gilchristii SLH14081]|uniref:Phosphotransferase enzyme family protein n=2 Tax=Blastomyces gilchristii (strain SLH14081) TaxID=559298 RepID=A0A179UT33_BLAGS|nr:phosphotransferase enzyme family protein [Blastomyces gilchristii SLH14081]OAT11194.1 phosphotransferase enzyme family protein [Blastomyces gilchristii SLH14081]
MPIKQQIQLSATLNGMQTEMDFLDSSFFTKAGHKSLPTAAEVGSLSEQFNKHPRPAPVKFEHLNLLVKFGPSVAVEEALTLRMLRMSFAEKIPVPEVYGWRVYQNSVFIYMELIQGDTLHDRWDSLNELDRNFICGQLREIISSLQQIEPDPCDSFIGSINRACLHDYVFATIPQSGPFKNVKAFNDWFSSLPQSWLPDSKRYRDPYRDYLPDNGAIRLTHGDLHRGNILISPAGRPRVLAVVDWAHAGWYPEYWEYCKALYTSDYKGEWRNVWIPKFLTAYEPEFAAFGEYVLQIGAVETIAKCQKPK